MPKLLRCLIGLVLLAGCAPTVFYNRDVPDSEVQERYKQDSYVCDRETWQYLKDTGNPGNPFSYPRQFKRCMESKGWTTRKPA